MSRAAVARKPTARISSRPAPEAAAGYWQQSQLPLNSLVLLLPMIVIYEVGTRMFAVGNIEYRIVASTLMQDFFRLFGATGRYLPALAVVGILLTWHIARNDPWRVDWSVLARMAAEGILLAVPLMALALIQAKYLPMYAVPTSTHPVQNLLFGMTYSLGAGIYEELVFRLAAFTLLSLVLVDWLKLNQSAAALLMVVISAGLFSAYHYLGPEVFSWRFFLFRTVAGIYFGAIFFLRGFGVTSCLHSSYDMLWVLLCFHG